mmetsp:Transcript_12875/g.36298  ORF Transcript_12875/g.36298 Transcript_12875/m.36298 type:complete len:310 (-) Transcript_12875:309-1238(-)
MQSLEQNKYLPLPSLPPCGLDHSVAAHSPGHVCGGVLCSPMGRRTREGRRRGEEGGEASRGSRARKKTGTSSEAKLLRHARGGARGGLELRGLLDRPPQLLHAVGEPREELVGLPPDLAERLPEDASHGLDALVHAGADIGLERLDLPVRDAADARHLGEQHRCECLQHGQRHLQQRRLHAGHQLTLHRRGLAPRSAGEAAEAARRRQLLRSSWRPGGGAGPQGASEGDLREPRGEVQEEHQGQRGAHGEALEGPAARGEQPHRRGAGRLPEPRRHLLPGPVQDLVDHRLAAVEGPLEVLRVWDVKVWV